MTDSPVKLWNRLYFLNTARLALTCAPAASILLSLIILAAGLVPVLQISVTSAFINLAIAAAGSGHIPPALYVQLTLLLLLIAYSTLSWPIITLISARAKMTIRQKLHPSIISKCARLDYRYIEDTKSWDLIARVTETPEQHIVDGHRALSELLSILISLVGVMSYIAAVAWWAFPVTAVFSVPLIVYSVRGGRANFEVSREVTERERKYNYLREVLLDRDYVDERTLFGYGDKINEEAANEYGKTYKIKVRTACQWYTKTKLGGVFNVLSCMIIILFLLRPTLEARISIGLFIAIVTGSFGLSNALSWGVSINIDSLFKTGEFTRDIDKLMALDETPGVLAEPSPMSAVESIEFINVRFRYPDTDTEILKNLSLKLEQGRHYAFVGANGAGKTTAVKLLTGLYRDYDGQILINGQDIRNYSEPELKGLFSVVYQDFVRYSFSIQENCAIGDVSAMDSPEMADRIEKALSEVELNEKVAESPQGLKTPLGKIHADGVDLSGGEWQRLAMARAIVNRAPIRILDEPTAALDPIAESRIYELFGRISEEKLTVFISHRLGSTKIADEIFVFSDGAILEHGDYDSLMSANGLYREMFAQQRSWYQNE